MLKSVHIKKPVTRSSFLSKSVVIFVVVILKMTTLFERNEDTPFENAQRWMGKNTFHFLLLNDDNMIGEH